MITEINNDFELYKIAYYTHTSYEHSPFRLNIMNLLNIIIFEENCNKRQRLFLMDDKVKTNDKIIVVFESI